MASECNYLSCLFFELLGCPFVELLLECSFVELKLLYRVFVHRAAVGVFFRRVEGMFVRQASRVFIREAAGMFARRASYRRSRSA